MSDAVQPFATSKNYSRFRIRLVAGVLSVAILIVAAVFWKIYTAHVNERQAAVAQTQTFAQAIDAHVTGAIQSVDSSLTGFASVIRLLDPKKDDSVEKIQHLLAEPGSAFNTNFAMLYVNAEGRGVAASNDLPVKGVYYGDRDYFRAHSSGRHEKGLYIGGPDIGRVSKQRSFVMSRRVEDTDGRFLGVIAAPMNAASFASVFENALFSKGASIGLIHRSGKVIARTPGFEGSFAADISDAALFRHLPVSAIGTYRSASAVDNQQRVLSYRTLKDLPLVVVVRSPETTLQRNFQRDIAIGSAGILAMSILMFAIGYFALRSYARLEQSEVNYRQLYRSVQAAERALFKNESRLRTITDNLPVLISYIDLEHRFRFANRTFENWFNLTSAEIIDKPAENVFSTEMYQTRKDHIQRAMSGHRVEFDSASEVLGVTRYLHTIYVPEITQDGNVMGIYALGIDTTALKESERQLRQLAQFDSLTGLPNRSYFSERLAGAAARCRRNGQPMAVMFLDVDHFKSINDRFGHSAGDAVLTEFAARLKAVLRATDTVGRWAGDEFVIAVEEQRSPAETEYVAIKILERISEPFAVAGEQMTITTSIGITFVYPGDIAPAEILDRADKALYKAKEAGRNTYHQEV
jgi:diguanylate cyclase (GGDEF)-like protein/PAS domain S-box-containing protein